jgi:hypothetical protein
MMNDVSNVKDIYTESHDSDDSVIIGLDSLCSRHLFPAKSDFISEIQPIEPFDIDGVGGNIQAIGQGTVQVHFWDPSGLLHDKQLVNVYYAPNAPVWLLSIPQLARDTKKQSNLCTGGTQSTLTWEGSVVTLKHSTPSGVPFSWAYIGNPASTTLFNICQSLYSFSAMDDQAFVNMTEEGTDSLVEYYDVTEHIDKNVDHL